MANRAVFDRCEGAEVRFIAVDQKHAVAWDDVDESLKRGLDFCQAAEDVRVVKLEVIDDHRLGEIVDELASLVEKCGVVFVALENEPVAVGETCALAKVVGNTTDEIAWIEAAMLEQPSEQGGGGGLPWVPETTSDRLPRRNWCLSSSGREQ